MFCNTCGSKLSKDDKKCRACGAPADQGEACGGFWGLVGAEPPVVPVPVKQPVKEISAGEVPAEQPAEKRKHPMTFWYGLAAVLAVLLLVQTVRVGVLNSRLEYMTWRVELLEAQKSTEPEETTEATEPEETTEATEPEQTTAPTEAAETTAPSEPAETTEPAGSGETEPPESQAPTEGSEESDEGVTGNG